MSSNTSGSLPSFIPSRKRNGGENGTFRRLDATIVAAETINATNLVLGSFTGDLDLDSNDIINISDLDVTTINNAGGTTTFGGNVMLGGNNITNVNNITTSNLNTTTINSGGALTTFGGDVDIDNNDLININNLETTSINTSGTTLLLGGVLDMGGNSIINLAAPTSAQDAATKAYVDSQNSLVSFKAAARAKTTGALNTTYNGVGLTLTSNVNGAITLDGVTLNVSDRVLVDQQAVLTENGIYVVTDTGSAGTPFILTRADDFDEDAEVTASSALFVQEGTLYQETGWVVSTDDPIVVDTNPIEWIEFTRTSLILAGDGLIKTTNSIDAVGTLNRITVNPNSIDIAATYVGQASITTLGTVSTGTWEATDVGVAHGGTGASTVADARTNLGLGTIAVQDVNYTLPLADGLANQILETDGLGVLSFVSSLTNMTDVETNTINAGGALTTLGGNLDMNTNAILNVTDLQTSTVNTAGGVTTFGGNLDVNTNNLLNVGDVQTTSINTLGAVTAFGGNVNLATNNLVNVGDIDTTTINTAGGVTTFGGNIDANTNAILNVTDVQTTTINTLGAMTTFGGTIDANANSILNVNDLETTTINNTLGATTTFGGDIDMGGNSILNAGGLSFGGDLDMGGNNILNTADLETTTINTAGALTTFGGSVNVTAGSYQIGSTNYVAFIGGTAAAPNSLLYGPGAGVGSTAAGVIAIGVDTYNGVGLRGAESIYLGNDVGSNQTLGANNNIFIGNRCGEFFDGAVRCVVVGVEAAQGDALNSLSGDFNVFMGSRAARFATTMNSSVGIGYEALVGDASNPISGTFNTCVGQRAGAFLTSNNSTFIGGRAGEGTTLNPNNGTNNVGVGYQSGMAITSGSFNVLGGVNAGSSLTTGTRNTAIGNAAGDTITVENFNTCIGDQADIGAGHTHVVALGASAVSTASNQLKVDNVVTHISMVGVDTSGRGNLMVSNGGDIRSTASVNWDGSTALHPTSNGAFDLGTNSLRWRDLFIINSIDYRSGASLLINEDGTTIVTVDGNGLTVNKGDANVANGSYQLGGVDWMGFNGGSAAAPSTMFYGPGTGVGSSGAGVNAIGLNTYLGATEGSESIYIGNEVAQKITLATNANIFIGNRSGRFMDGAKQSVVIGLEAAEGDALNQFAGINDILIGNRAGQFSTTPTNSIGIGYQALKGDASNPITGNNNVCIGSFSGEFLTTGGNNSFYGWQSGTGSAVTPNTGINNVGVGYRAGYRLESGSFNTLMGVVAGQNITSATRCVVIGNSAGDAITTEVNNTLIGDQTNIGVGHTNCVVLGQGATTTASNQLKIRDAITNMEMSGISTSGTGDIVVSNAGNITSTSTVNWDGSNLTINNYSLPASDGTSGQVLQTDGAGNVSFNDVGSGINFILFDEVLPEFTANLSQNTHHFISRGTPTGGVTPLFTLPNAPPQGTFVVTKHGLNSNDIIEIEPAGLDSFVDGGNNIIVNIGESYYFIYQSGIWYNLYPAP